MKRFLICAAVFCLLCAPALAEWPAGWQDSFTFDDHVNVEDTLEDLYGKADSLIDDVLSSLDEVQRLYCENYYRLYGRYPMLLRIVVRPKNVHAGEAVAAAYAFIGGSGEYRSANYRWDYSLDDTWVTGETLPLESNAGILTFHHTVGSKIRLYIEFEDTEGRKKSGYSDEVVVLALNGDVNGDGTVDGRDVLRLARFIAGEDVTIDEKAADTNGDGTVDGRDVLRLAKQLSGG